jgi:restriction system protein
MTFLLKVSLRALPILLLLLMIGLIARYPAIAILVGCLVAASAAVFFTVRRDLRRKRAASLEAMQLSRAADLNALLALTPREFEDTVASLLAAVGYSKVEVLGGSGDLAVDIACQDQQGCPTVVQCKLYAPTRSVGSPEIQTFIGMAYAHHQAAHALYFTTADYTRAARELAGQHKIELYDGRSLVDLARSVGAARHAQDMRESPPGPRALS